MYLLTTSEEINTYWYLCMYLYKSHFNSHHVVLTVNSLTVISAGVDYLPQRANKY